MNKDEILAASDEQLNEWAAVKVRGWNRKRNQFSTPPDWWAVGDHGVVSIERYAPTTDIAQAIALLDHLAEQQFFNSIYSNVNRLHRVSIGKRGEWGYCNGSCEDASRSRAIVVACLLALADVEELEQQTVTP